MSSVRLVVPAMVAGVGVGVSVLSVAGTGSARVGMVPSVRGRVVG